MWRRRSGVTEGIQVGGDYRTPIDCEAATTCMVGGLCCVQRIPLAGPREVRKGGVHHRVKRKGEREFPFLVARLLSGWTLLPFVANLPWLCGRVTGTRWSGYYDPQCRMLMDR